MALWLMAMLAATSAVSAQPEFPEPRNLVALAGHCKLDEPALAHLRRYGLVVLPPSPGAQLQQLYYTLASDRLPVYITSDAMLYLWYEAQRESMMAVERQYLQPQLKRFVAGMLDATQRLQQGGDDEMLRHNAVLLAVVHGLLEPEWKPPEGIAEAVEAETRLVMEHNVLVLFPGDDYTQYEPRGHYADDPTLASYFRAAKYLGRHYFRVEDPKHPDDAVVETRCAALLALAMREGEGLADLYRGIYDLRAFLAGPADSIGLDQVLDACNAVYGEEWGREVVEDIEPLRQELASDRYSTTRITNRALHPFSDVMPPKNVAVLGVHHIPDSELFQRTIDPEIPGRLLPTGLEVAAALGSEPAVQKLKPETVDFPQVVQVVREFGPQMLGEGVYGEWLSTLRTLSQRPEGLPAFAQGSAYDEKQINCCLTSWAHLRHNYILYGAHGYTPGGIGGSIPFSGLVEPIPEFFSQYAQMCRNLAAMLEEREVTGRAVEVLGRLADKAEAFERCARDQLAGRDISWAAEDIAGFGTWMNSVFYDSPLVVADVCTDSDNHDILHAASGPFRQIAVLVEHEDEWMGAAGYVGSYYEFIEPDLGRVTDAEWKQRVEADYGAPEPPSWLPLLQAPRSEEEVRMHARLAELRTVIAEADTDEAQAAVGAFVDEYKETEWAPAAVLLLAKHLLDADDYEQAAEVAASARPLYGCDARDSALGITERAEWRQKRAAREAESQRVFEEALAATEPQEGLSAEEELKRQDRRARAFLDRAGVVEGQFGENARPYMERLIAECPASQYRPLAELGLVVSQWPERGLHPAYEPAATELADDTRRELLPLGERYADSRIGQAAQVAAAAVLYWSGRFRECYEEMRRLVDLQAPDPEPYPQAAKRLGWRNPLLESNAGALAHDVTQQVIREACDAEDLGLVREIVAFVDEHGLEDTADVQEWVVPALEYMADEPEALRAYLGARSMHAATRYPPPTSEHVTERAVAVADRFPNSKPAPAALYFAQRTAYGQPEVRAGIQHRLADEYPDSVESLVCRVNQLTGARRYDEALALQEKLRARYPDRASVGQAPTYTQQLLHDMADPERRRQDEQDRLAALRETWGKWIDEAGLDDDFLGERRGWAALVEELVKRLPDQELDILLQIPREGAYGWRDVVAPVLQRHPGDPRTVEVHWRLGSLEDLLAIVAAGPETSHFDEAAEKLSSWTDPYEYKLDAIVARCRMAADEYKGTPGEVMAVHALARTYLQFERPERAAETIKEALERIEEERPLRDRLGRLLETARRQIAAKRQASRPEKLWEVALDSRRYGEARADSILRDGRVYLTAQTRQGVWGIVCLDAATGQHLWDAPLGSAAASIVPVDGRIYAANAAGMALCLDARTGEQLWEREMSDSRQGTVWCAPAGDRLIVYWNQGLLAAIDPESGATQWEEDGLYADGPPIVGGERLFLVKKDGIVCAKRTADGVTAWEWDWRTARPEGEAEGWRETAVGIAVDAGGRPVVLAHGLRRGVLAVLDPADGEPVWLKEVKPTQGSPFRLRSADPEILLATDREIVALDPADGSLAWSLARHQSIRQAAALEGQLRLVTTHDGLVAVDRSLGEKVATFEGIDASEGLMAEQAPDGVVVYAVNDSSVGAWRIGGPPGE
jgi:outer membrane protein assembly factor BamB